MVYVIQKYTGGYATGMATAFNGMNTTTRVLHAVNNAWTSVSAVNAFSAAQ